MYQSLKEWIGRRILRYLNTPSRRYAPFFSPPIDILRRSLQPGDILLIEGNTRLSAVIKFLTQSTWSHAALYVGDAGKAKTTNGERDVLLEAYSEVGVFSRRFPNMTIQYTNLPAYRADGQRAQEDHRLRVSPRRYAIRQQADIRSCALSLSLSAGSGVFEAAIVGDRKWRSDPGDCSTLIAEAFASVHYPILPENVEDAGYGIAPFVQSETDHIRKHGLYTPRDFDISPYFAVIKPVIVNQFNYHTLEWSPKKMWPIKKVKTRRLKVAEHARR